MWLKEGFALNMALSLAQEQMLDFGVPTKRSSVLRREDYARSSVMSRGTGVRRGLFEADRFLMANRL
jgi:hypothetical protein